MAFFNVFKIKSGKVPIPDIPPYIPPVIPSPDIPEDGSTPLTPVPSITGGSIVTLYQVTDESIKLNKTLGTGINYTAMIVVDCDIAAPILEIESVTNIINYNYAYIDTTQRYYFVKVVCMPNGYYRLILNIDRLMSFKDGIKNCIGTLKKTEDSTHYDLDIYDGDIKVEQGRAIKISAYHPTTGSTYFLQNPTAILVACGKLSSGGSE